MARLDIERQQELEPKRIYETKTVLEEKGFRVIQYGTRLEFEYKGSKIMFWPYSGWHSGKTIKDGRGFKKLIKQLI